MGSSGPRLWIGVVVAVIVVVAIIAGAYPLGFSGSKAAPTTPRPPPLVVVLVPNGTRLTVEAAGYLEVGPFNLRNNSEWTPAGAWWETNGTDFCLMSQSFFDQWNKTAQPRNCDGFGIYGDPTIGGWQSIPFNWGVQAGIFDLVWYILGGKVPIALNVTAEINVTTIGQLCDISPSPVGC